MIQKIFFWNSPLALYEKMLHYFWIGFKDDAFAKAFGLGLDGQMLAVKGRILAPPKLSYLDKAKGNLWYKRCFLKFQINVLQHSLFSFRDHPCDGKMESLSRVQHFKKIVLLGCFRSRGIEWWRNSRMIKAMFIQTFCFNISLKLQSFCMRLKNDGEKCGMTFSKPTLLKGRKHELDKKFAVILLCKKYFHWEKKVL